jgi:hypothetical protein
MMHAIIYNSLSNTNMKGLPVDNLHYRNHVETDLPYASAVVMTLDQERHGIDSIDFVPSALHHHHHLLPHYYHYHYYGEIHDYSSWVHDDFAAV